MLRLPHRVSLAQETTATLKEWISGGVLGTVLPGEIQLKTRLGVGRETLRRSLRTLEHEGWISSGQQGKQRRLLVNTAPSAGATQKLPVTFLSPQVLVDRMVLLELDDLQKRLAAQGRSLQFLASNAFHRARPDRQLELLVEKNPSSAWVLYFVGEKTQRWFERRGIPAFIYGTPAPDIALPFVVNDWGAAAFHAGVQLVRLGHKFVGMLRPKKPMPGTLLIIQGLERALGTIQPKGSLALFADDSPQDVVRSLEMAFGASPRPTALIFTSSGGLLTCFSWMISKGIAAPRDISLISLPSDSWYADLNPPVCYYQSNSSLFAHLLGQRVMELVETGEVTAKSVRMRLEYQKGATIGPPPQI